MRFVFDIDGTICEETSDYENFHKVKKFSKMVDFINKLYDDGHYIIIFTSRGMIASNNIIAKAYNKWYSKTESQLKSWALKYHELHMGKPWADIYVDDKAFVADPNCIDTTIDNLKNLIEKKNKPT